MENTESRDTPYTRDMTYGEVARLLRRLVGLGVLYDDDAVLEFIQRPGVDFACPFLYVMSAARCREIAAAHVPDLDQAFIDASSVKSVLKQLDGRSPDEVVGLLDFKDESKTEDEKFGGLLTYAGLLYNDLYRKGLVGKMDDVSEIASSVFVFRLFNGKWIPGLAKVADGRGIKVPDTVRSWVREYGKDLVAGQVMHVPPSSMDAEMLEWLEITRNFHFYDGQDDLSGSQSV